MNHHSPCAGSREFVLVAGDTLIQEGELGDTAYCILDGEVKVWKRSDSGPVELARLVNGAIFGEMSIVDEKPRSASVVAVRDTRLKELKRDQFLDCFQHDPEFAASLLRVLFERLRETGAKLAGVQDVDSKASDRSFPSPNLSVIPPSETPPFNPPPASDPTPRLRVTLEGLTQPAREALPSNPYVIDHLPCRIGRSSDDKLAYNDLIILDFEPYQVSINHLLIFQEQRSGSNQGRIGIFDRGSSRGSWLNDCALGGLMADDTATFIAAGSAELVLGNQDSLFRFRISVSATAN